MDFCRSNGSRFCPLAELEKNQDTSQPHNRKFAPLAKAARAKGLELIARKADATE
jgi:hypothetical protein